MSGRFGGFSRNRLADIFLALLLAACYLYTFPRWADPNQNSRLDMVVAVVDDHTFQINKYVKNTVDYAKVGDNYYSDKAPGVAFLGIPIFAGLKLGLDQPWTDRIVSRLEDSSAFRTTLNPQGSGILKEKVRFAIAQVVLSFCLSLLPTIAIAVLMSHLLGRWGASFGLRIGLPLAYGLVTPVFAYANSFYSHQLSAALCFSIFVWVSSTTQLLSRKSLFLAGIGLAWATISEYPTACLAGILGLYIVYRLVCEKAWTWTAYLIAGGVIPLIGWMAYNAFIFGGPLSLGYSYSEQWTTQHQTGFLSLTFPHLDAIWGVTFSPFRGLFFYSPYLLLGLLGILLWSRNRVHRAAYWTVLIGVALTFLMNVSSIMWWGGFSVGPRYLLPAVPFLILPISFVYQKWGRQDWFKLLSLGLCAWSLIATWGLTLAGQSFPSDALYNPLVEYAWTNWVKGNVARNLGTLLGFSNIRSFLPLIFILLLILACWWLLDRRNIVRSNKVSPSYRESL